MLLDDHGPCCAVLIRELFVIRSSSLLMRVGIFVGLHVGVLVGVLALFYLPDHIKFHLDTVLPPDRTARQMAFARRNFETVVSRGKHE
jgi:hypothetical protein